MNISIPGPVLTDRPRLFAFCAALTAVNGMAAIILDSIGADGTLAALLGLAGVSAVFWFALYAVATIAREGEGPRLTTIDRVVAGAVVLGALLPYPMAGSIATLGAAAYLFVQGAARSRERRMAIVLLAITGTLLWGRILLPVFAPQLLGLDAWAVGQVAGSPVLGNTVGFTGSGERFAISPSCSSLHNISLAVILWATLTQLLRLTITPRLIAVCIAGVATMAGVNCLRLATIAANQSAFEYWHVGAGAGMFGWLALIASGLVIGGGIIVAGGDRYEPLVLPPARSDAGLQGIGDPAATAR